MHSAISCNSFGCPNALESIEEMVIGLCSIHLKMLRSEDCFAGICWECGNITLIESKEQGKDLFISNKYIFSKGCRHCTDNEENGLSWMTIPKETNKVKILSQVKVSGVKSYGSYLIRERNDDEWHSAA